MQNIFDKNKAIPSSILDKNKAGAATRKHAYLLFHLQNYYANLVEEENYPKFYFSDNGIVSLFLDRKETVQCLKIKDALKGIRSYSTSHHRAAIRGE